MYCFRCGHQLPPKGNTCPVCDTPQKRRQRYRQRLLLGLIIFLAGSLVGSLVDSLLFKGKAWEHTFLGTILGRGPGSSTPASGPLPVPPVAPPATPETTPKRLPDVLPVKPPEPVPLETASIASLPVPGPASAPVVALPASAATGPAVSESLPVASSTPSPEPAVLIPSTSAGHPFDPARIPDATLAYEATDPLEEGPDVNYHGSLSADGQFLVFASNRPVGGKTGLYQCYQKDLHAGTAAEVAFSWPGNVWTPEFSTDGKSLVFSSDSQKPEQVFLYDREGRQSRQLTTGNSKNMMPSLSPDGKFIAFVSNRRGNNDIWIVGIDGQNLIQITTGSEDDREPRWWPDGRSLVFTRIKEKYKNSLIMRVFLDPLGTPQPLFPETARQWLADPSPDGRYVAFVRSKNDDGSGNSIFVRRVDSGAEFALEPFKGGECYRPIWTRDGSGLVFHAERLKRKNLFLARLKRTPVD